MGNKKICSIWYKTAFIATQQITKMLQRTFFTIWGGSQITFVGGSGPKFGKIANFIAQNHKPK